MTLGLVTTEPSPKSTKKVSEGVGVLGVVGQLRVDRQRGVRVPLVNRLRGDAQREREEGAGFELFARGGGGLAQPVVRAAGAAGTGRERLP